MMHIHYISYNGFHSEPFFTFERNHGMADFLLVNFKSPCFLTIRDKSYTLSEPSAVLFSPYTPLKYTAMTDSYYDDYLHFAPIDKDDFLSKLHFPLNTPIKIKNERAISPILKCISDEHHNNTDYLLDIQYHHIMLLMLRIAEEWNAYNRANSEIPYFDKLQALRSQIQKNPSASWRISDMAAQVMLSPAYFQVLYKRAFGVTCMTDVIQAKLDVAKELLLSTDMPVSAIAEEAGYSHVYHFIRQFKKSTGITPGAFRKGLR